MKRSNDPNVWTDKKGQTFKIPDLTDEHLRNILRVIYRSKVRKMRDHLLKEASKLEDEARANEGYDLKDAEATIPFYDLAGEKRDLATSTDHAVLLHFVPQLATLEFEARRRSLRV